jgi:uncharacterized membrane protein YfcA
LAWQNRINLIPSLIILTGLTIALVKTIKLVLKRNTSSTYPQIAESFLIIFFSIAFAIFFYANIKFPDPVKGNTIKAAYILFANPVLFYFGATTILNLKRNKILYFFLILIIALSILFNLNFDLY